MSTSNSDLVERRVRRALANLDISWWAAWRMRRRYASLRRFAKRYKYQHIGSSLLYVQGSARLGTVVRPIDGGDYDLDAALSLIFDDPGAEEQAKAYPMKLKRYAGRIVGSYVQKHSPLVKLRSKRRCWTLVFRLRDFHLDVIPAIPNADRSPNGLLITDRTRRVLIHSNPADYAEWFYMRMRVNRKGKVAVWLAKHGGLNPDTKIPWWIYKTNLQRAVQFLKRHRDVYFRDHSGHPPPSIIITTLAAHSYEDKGSLLATLRHIAKGMERHILHGREVPYRIANPAQWDENFADRWCEDPSRARSFDRWRDRLIVDLEQFAGAGTEDEVEQRIRDTLGDRVAPVAGPSRSDSQHRLGTPLPPLAAVPPSPTSVPVRLTGDAEGHGSIDNQLGREFVPGDSGMDVADKQLATNPGAFVQISLEDADSARKPPIGRPPQPSGPRDGRGGIESDGRDRLSGLLLSIRRGLRGFIAAIVKLWLFGAGLILVLRAAAVHLVKLLQRQLLKVVGDRRPPRLTLEGPTIYRVPYGFISSEIGRVFSVLRKFRQLTFVMGVTPAWPADCPGFEDCILVLLVDLRNYDDKDKLNRLLTSWGWRRKPDV